MALSIAKRENGNVVILDLSGDSAISDGTILQQTVRGLTDEGKRLFVLNLQHTRYLDSFGLGQLVSAFISVRDQKGQVRIVYPNENVRKLLKYSRIDSVLQIMETEEQAVLDLQKQASA